MSLKIQKTLYVSLITFLFFTYISSIRFGIFIPIEWIFSLLFTILTFWVFAIYENFYEILIDITDFGLDDIEEQ